MLDAPTIYSIGGVNGEGAQFPTTSSDEYATDPDSVILADSHVRKIIVYIKYHLNCLNNYFFEMLIRLFLNKKTIIITFHFKFLMIFLNIQIFVKYRFKNENDFQYTKFNVHIILFLYRKTSRGSSDFEFH